MSATHNILTQYDGDMESLKRELGAFLGLEFKSTKRYSDLAGFWAVAGNYGVGLSEDDFDSELLSKYNFVIEIGANDKDLEAVAARETFEKLKALDLPLILMANDLDIELDRFEPPATT